MANDKLNVIASEYKKIVENISFSVDIHAYKIILITSSHSGAGTSTVASNLAMALKARNTAKKILLIDANLRKPSLDNFFYPKKYAGLSELICGRAALDDVINENVEGNVDAIFAGSVPPNTYDLLSSANMAEILNNCKLRYDHIIIDTPACEKGNEDAISLMGDGVGVVFVCKQNKTKIEDLNALASKVKAAKADVLGVVLKKVGYRIKPLFKFY